MHVVGHYHDFFSPSQLRYILGTCNGMAYMALWMELLLLLLLLLSIPKNKTKISVKSHYIHYLIHPRHDHLLHVIFLVYITYVLTIQRGVR